MRRFFFLCALPFFCSTAWADSLTLSFTSWASLNRTGAQSAFNWSNPANAASSNNVRSVVSAVAPWGGYLTGAGDWLVGTVGNGAVPLNSTINGIEVRIERAESFSSPAVVKDSALQLFLSGSPVGANRAATTVVWPVTEGTVVYGSPTDLWGYAWLPAEINAASFGVGLSASVVQTDFDESTASVDHMWLTVYYTVNAQGITQAQGDAWIASVDEANRKAEGIGIVRGVIWAMFGGGLVLYGAYVLTTVSLRRGGHGA